jgi:hypothetical protein
LPAGVRMGPFSYTAPAQKPLAAVVTFGPGGLEGRLEAGPFQDLADALVSTPGGRNFAVPLRPDNSFSVGSEDILPAGQFLASAVLTDRQQRRQSVYRELLKRGPGAGRSEGPDVLYAWARPLDMHFTLDRDAKFVGNALLMVPLHLERPAPGGRMTIPGPFVPCRRILEGASTRLTLEATVATDMHLRFQLPEVVLPFKVERARLLTRIDAPDRRVTVSGLTDGGPVELHRVESPLDPLRVDVSDERLLRLDAEGGLHLNLSVSDTLRAAEAGQRDLQAGQKWTIEYIELEVTGRSQE